MGESSLLGILGEEDDDDEEESMSLARMMPLVLAEGYSISLLSFLTKDLAFNAANPLMGLRTSMEDADEELLLLLAFLTN